LINHGCSIFLCLFSGYILLTIVYTYIISYIVCICIEVGKIAECSKFWRPNSRRNPAGSGPKSLRRVSSPHPGGGRIARGAKNFCRKIQTWAIRKWDAGWFFGCFLVCELCELEWKIEHIQYRFLHPGTCPLRKNLDLDPKFEVEHGMEGQSMTSPDPKQSFPCEKCAS
jgi:hypothetical protein